MSTIICPKCGTANSGDAINCRNCRIILKLALEHSEKSESPENDSKREQFNKLKIEDEPNNISLTKGELILSIFVGVIGATLLEFLPEVLFDYELPGIELGLLNLLCFLWPIVGGLFGWIGSIIATQKNKTRGRIIGGAFLGGLFTSIVFRLTFYIQ